MPAKDEEESLPLLVARVLDVCAKNGLTLRDIVLVDDGSRDKTWTVMAQLAADKLKQVSLVKGVQSIEACDCRADGNAGSRP